MPRAIKSLYSAVCINVSSIPFVRQPTSTMTEGMVAFSSNRAGAACTPRKIAEVVFASAPAMDWAKARLGPLLCESQLVVRENDEASGERPSLVDGR